MYEARTHWSQLLERVAGGERITITRHGVPVAHLVPAKADHKQVEEAVRALREFRRGRRLDGLSLRQMLEEGRRWRWPGLRPPRAA